MRNELLSSFAPLLLVGCYVTSPEGTARTRAANDFSCTEEQVTMTNVGGLSYRADGCGKRATYTCANANTCVLDSNVQTTSASQPAQALPPPAGSAKN